MTEDEMLNAKILIVDDADANLRLLEDLLAREGFTQVISTADSTRAIDLFTAFQPDLILLDLMMPVLDGYAILEILSRHIPKDEYLPVLVLTADATISAKRKALALGAKDFLTKPFDTIEAMLRVWNLLETRLLYRQLKSLKADTSPLLHFHKTTE
jgi:CheY-like chemotaxis protein